MFKIKPDMLLFSADLPKVLGKFDICTEDDDSIEDETESEVVMLL